MDLFNLFTTTSYTFLELEGDSEGLVVKSEADATGIIKFRDGLVQGSRSEAYESQSTLKIRPDESFINELGGHLKLVGHGIRCEGEEYRIKGVTVATDFDTGLIEFYRATLSKESFVWASSLPLE